MLYVKVVKQVGLKSFYHKKISFYLYEMIDVYYLLNLLWHQNKKIRVTRVFSKYSKSRQIANS